MASWLLSLTLLVTSPQSPVGVSPDEGSPDQEGFIQVIPEKGAPVKKLHDETGAGEKPPSVLLELSAGLLNVDFLPAGPGGLASAGAFWRPSGDWWLGVRLLGGGAPQRHDAGPLGRGALTLEGRRYFMLHQEANRFVMGHVLAGLGGEALKTREATFAGPALTAGAGVGVALSPTLYLGVQYALSFPWWLRDDGVDGLYASYSTFLFFVTVGF